MTFDRLHQVITYTIALMGLGALFLGGEMQSSVALLIGGGVLLSTAVRESHRLHPRFEALFNAAILALLGIQIVRGFLGGSLLSLAIEFAAGLQIAKLFHRVEARDYQHIQALAMLHLIAATVLTTGVEYAFVFGGFVLTLPWMLALTHLRSEIEKNHAKRSPLKTASTKPAIKTQSAQAPKKKQTLGPSPKAWSVLRSKNIAGARFLGWTATLSVPLFVITAMFFLIFPRVGLGFLSVGEETGRPVTGFGNDVQLGGFGRIRNDATVVLRVRPTEQAEEGVRTTEIYRLRGTSFDHYENSRWTRSSGTPRRVEEIAGYFSLTRRIPRQDATREMEIILDPLDERVLFLLPGTMGIYVSPHVEAGYDVYPSLALDSGYDLRYADSGGTEMRYTVVLSDALPAVTDRLAPDDIERYLQLPEHLEAIRALARDHAGEGSPEQQVRRLTRWLRSSGEFSYSLDMPDTRGRDPLEVFLTDAKRGHCEYFSTALAVMLRTLGIPARNVTGFLGGAYNPYGRYTAVRQGDAHSWVEAWFDDGWQMVDPTPSAHLDAAPTGEGLFSNLQAFMDAVRMRWSRDVVGYDLKDQVDGLRDLYGWFHQFRTRSEPEERNTSAGQEQTENDVTGGMAIPLLLLAALGFWWLRKKRHKIRTRRASPLSTDEIAVRALFDRLDARLTKQGFERPKSRTPREHLAVLEEQQYEGLALVGEITEFYEAVRYRKERLDPTRLLALKRRI